MNVTQLYQDHSIPYADEGHRHHRPGWVNIECPFCTGNPGMHLGYNTNNNFYVCHRCGWHPVTKVIAKLTNTNEETAKTLIKQYGGHVQVRMEHAPKCTRPFKFPSGTTPLSGPHKQYLSRRGFDPDRLEHEWGLISTGPIALLDNTDYKHRILAPIEWGGACVSFQGRDATDKHTKKYLACPQERESIHHKEILYGHEAAWTEVGIVVEGITDVWRLGERSCATFGIKYTPKQLRLLATLFSRLFIVFDDDPQAIKQAYALKTDLEFRGVDAQTISIVGDPGGMKQEEADYFVKQLLS